MRTAACPRGPLGAAHHWLLGPMSTAALTRKARTDGVCRNCGTRRTFVETVLDMTELPRRWVWNGRMPPPVAALGPRIEEVDE